MNYCEDFQKIINCIPVSDEAKISWESLERTRLGPLLHELNKVPQNPEYHAEGNVYCHTKYVCEELIKLDEYQEANKDDKIILFLSALLHDIGKIRCTGTEDGKIFSEGHASKGAVMARELLWRDFGLCGSKEKQQLRESICFLIKYHSFPPHALTDTDSEFRLLRVASIGKLTEYFSLRKLCVLSKADILGRECFDKQDYLERTACCKMLAEEIGCIDYPYEFKNGFSQRAYFLKKTNWREQEMFNDSWGKVILLSGLPGTGKDTWILKNYSDLPMVSLDEIRKQLKILPTDSQGAVIAAAQETAKNYLRNRKSFIWNATNITESTRTKLVSLFERYGACVEIVFLETEWEEQLKRNSERKKVVPQNEIEKMLSKLEIPQPFESEKVIWETV